jgi:hypothetical protein
LAATQAVLSSRTRFGSPLCSVRDHFSLTVLPIQSYLFSSTARKSASSSSYSRENAHWPDFLRQGSSCAPFSQLRFLSAWFPTSWSGMGHSAGKAAAAQASFFPTDQARRLSSVPCSLISFFHWTPHQDFISRRFCRADSTSRFSFSPGSSFPFRGWLLLSRGHSPAPDSSS